jgi:putative N6-adenine-specific DNA methylase
MVTRELIATCSRGLEEVLADEILDLGGRKVESGRGMVRFQGTRGMMITACLGLRTAMRILIPVASGPAGDKEQLYRLAARIAWEDYLSPGGTLAVNVAGRSPSFSNTVFAAQVVKDAVVDRVRDRRGARPSVDLVKPHVPIHLHLKDGEASIALDAAGTPLSKRGYRPKGGPAPLNSALAAGLLLLADYDGSRPLLDPMGGTGTFAAEAAMIATRLAPGLYRHFAFERWPDHRQDLLVKARRDLEARRRPAPCPIVSADHDPKALKVAKQNLGVAGVSDWVDVVLGEATTMETPGEESLIVINPPYGKRLGEAGALGGLYSALGDRLKAIGGNSTAWILAGNRELSKKIGLKASRRIPIFNGPIECRWMRFDLYEGSRRGDREGKTE